MELNIFKTNNIEHIEALCAKDSDDKLKEANLSRGGDCYNCNCDCRYDSGIDCGREKYNA